MLRVAIVVALAASSLAAALPEWTASVPVERGRVSIWVPPGVRSVAGLFLLGQLRIESELVAEPSILKECAAGRIAIVYFEPHLSGTFHFWEPANRDGERLLNALAALARVSKHPEIARVPWITAGHSTAGVFARNVAYWAPERVAAIVHIKSGNFHQRAHLPPSGTLRGIPILAINGQFEVFGPEGGIRPEYGLETQWIMARDDIRRFRSSDAEHLMSLVVEPGADHFNGTPEIAEHIALFLRKTAERRLPRELPPGSEPVKALPIRAADGVGGSAGLPGGKKTDFWFYDGQMAEAAVALHRNIERTQRITQPRATWLSTTEFRVAAEWNGQSHARTPFVYRARSGQPLEQTGADTFRVTGAATAVHVNAFHPGGDGYASTVAWTEVKAFHPAAELDAYLTAIADRQLNQRAERVAAIPSKAEVEKRQQSIREWLTEAAGGLPETKTPLNARITGGFDRNGYRVEHVVFESLPGFRVPGNVYVPTGVKPPYPAVIGVAGHSLEGKASETYQRAWIGLVRRGFLVLAIDPPGQGERLEYIGTNLGSGVPQHNMAGLQCLLTGSTFARYQMWDGIRAFDYLVTRRDVDGTRIAVAGNSGGGTQSAYLAVVERRLASAVISCYITDWKDLWRGPGPQDAEQCFPNFLRDGWNFGDFLVAFAPKPITMLTGTRDYFPILGARATYREVQRTFATADAPGRAGFFEYDDEHGWHRPRREATYGWLEKWLQGREASGPEMEEKTEPPAALNATSTGQVLTSYPRSETVRSLNAREAERLAAALRVPDAATIARRLEIPVARPPEPPRAVKYGPTEMLVETEPGIRVRVRRWAPANPQQTAAALIVVGMEPGESMRSGNVVYSVEPRGSGGFEAAKGIGGYSGAYQLAQRAMLVGKPLAGMRTYDLLRIFDLVAADPAVDAARISVHGAGNGGVLALFAAALEPRIANVTVERTLHSYLSLARADTHSGMEEIVVPGVLRDFDLPGVVRRIGASKVRIVQPILEPPSERPEK